MQILDQIENVWPRYYIQTWWNISELAQVSFPKHLYQIKSPAMNKTIVLMGISVMCFFKNSTFQKRAWKGSRFEFVNNLKIIDFQVFHSTAVKPLKSYSGH